MECTTSANRTVTCLYSADGVACMSRRAALVTELGVRWQFGAAGRTEQSHRGQSTATIPAGVHVSIVSPLLGGVRHIAFPPPTRSFDPRMSSYSRRVRPVSTVKKRLLPPGTTQVSSSKAGRLLQRPIGDLTGVDAVGHLVDHGPDRRAGSGADAGRRSPARGRPCCGACARPR